MVSRHFFFLLIFTALISGCYEDFENTSTTTSDVVPSISYRNHILGTVQDTFGATLANVEITLNGTTIISNDAGEFKFENTPIDEIGSYLAAKGEGFIATGIRLYPVKALSQNLNITMVREHIGFSIDNSTGGKVTDKSGLEVNFAAQSILSNGIPYVGTYNVRIFYIDPKNKDQYQQQLRAYDVDEKVLSSLPKIEALSMAYISIIDENGQVLEVAPQSLVTVRFPITNGANNLPDALDLLSFNEELGLWVDEGTATKEGQTYNAELNHFSWWSVSNIIDSKELCLKFESTEASPPIDNVFVINTISGSHVYFGHVDYENEICIPVPAQGDFNLEVYKYCIVQLAERVILSSDITNEPIVIPIEENSSGFSISVQVTDCDGVPRNGTYTIDFVGRVDELQVEGSQFTIELDECFGFENVDIILTDEHGELYIALLAIDPFRYVYNTEIKVCPGQQSEESLLIHNGEVFRNCKALINPEEVLIFSESKKVLIGIDSKEIGESNCRIFSNAYIGNGLAEVTEFGIVGEFIVGTYKSTNDFLGSPVNGSFRALIER